MCGTRISRSRSSTMRSRQLVASVAIQPSSVSTMVSRLNPCSIPANDSSALVSSSSTVISPPWARSARVESPSTSNPPRTPPRASSGTNAESSRSTSSVSAFSATPTTSITLSLPG